MSSRHKSLTLIALSFFLQLGFGRAFKLPFRVNDVFLVLPRQVSWPILNNLHSAVDLLPSFVGTVAPSNGSVEWKGACFHGNEAWVESDERCLGGGVLYLKVEGCSNLACV